MNYYLAENELNGSSAVLRIHGPDANTYLQGQITQDLRVPPGETVYGLFLDQKGRVVADSHVLKRAENDFLLVSFSLGSAALRERLEAYLIADEVEIEDQTTRWAGVLWWGDEGEPLPALPADGVDLPGRRAGSGARQWLVPREMLAARLQDFAERAVAADFATAARERILAGIPAVPADIGPRDLPNEGGLDDVAISYIKGCYLGQEVMARLKNLGQVRRALHVIRGPGQPPAVIAPLYQGERKVGELRSSASEGAGFVGMAMLSLLNLDSAGKLGASPSLGDITLVRRV